MITIYTTENNARLGYILDFIFSQVLKVDYRVVVSLDQVQQEKEFIINYSAEVIPAQKLQIIPKGLLGENNIQAQKIEVSQWNELPVFFQTQGGDIPFDLLSAAFYLLSRYEEYLPFTPDEHDRYPVTESLAYRNHFLATALIDRWVIELKKMIQRSNSTIHFPEASMTFLPTYDIDIAYSYRGKGLLRNFGGFLHDIILGKFSAVQHRMAVLSGKATDPYDSYNFLDSLHATFELSPIYFFLVGKPGSHDKNLSPSHPLMEDLIAETKTRYRIGIHPSYRSKDDEQLMKKEIDRLGVQQSRQHYIRFSLPSTYRILQQCGITADYSMGYGSMNGFRASTSFPHFWFDLERNEVSRLMLFPFCYMECNSFFEQKLNAQQALVEMEHYLVEVNFCGGTLTTIWHNFSLGDDPFWQGWREVYKYFIQKVNQVNLNK